MDVASGDVAKMASLENGLAAMLMQASYEVARSECLDVEQRAEVYTILKTLKANTETHCAMVRQLARQLKEKTPDA
jgi:hypothetical protein